MERSTDVRTAPRRSNLECRVVDGSAVEGVGCEKRADCSRLLPRNKRTHRRASNDVCGPLRARCNYGKLPLSARGDMEEPIRARLQEEQRPLTHDQLRFPLDSLPRVADDTPHGANP